MPTIKQDIQRLKKHIKKVSIYLPVPTCPHCQAKVLPNPSLTFFRCYDCNMVYVVEEIGQTEREFICTERKLFQ